MSNLRLHSQTTEGCTLLSNIFIDHYMPRANGEFVKVYLYLLRYLPVPERAIGLSDIADAFDCTETDVLRALRYWEKAGLLKLSFNAENQLEEISFCTPKKVAPASDAARSVSHDSMQETALSNQTPTQPTPPASPLTPDKIKSLREREEIAQLLFIAEQYLGKTLSSTEVQRLLYFYDSLGFGADLIEYLIEYCVSHGHRSIRYIEKVALSWHSNGITTVAMAKEESSAYKKTYFQILRALGVTNRNPVPSEIQTMDRWLGEYGFDLELVLEACARTVKATGKPSFQYTDGILNSWKKKGVRTMAHVQALDLEHLQNQERQASRRAKPQATNRFNNFTQRDYNYSELEKQLLKQ